MADYVPIQLGEWRPDMDPHMSPSLTQADNCLPMAGAYAPFPAHATVAGSVLPTAAKGFYSTLLPDGTPAIYGATTNTVYRINAGSVTSIYAGGAISASRWWFAQVGGKLCAGCDGLPPVGGDLGASLTPLGGSPPDAAVGAVVNRDYLVLGNLKREPVDGTVENRVRWSGVLNPDSWGTSVATGADFEDMHDEGGPVIQIAGRSTGLVFQRKAITRMQFTGNASTVFAFTVLELGRGAQTAGGVVDAGQAVLYRADDGFFAHDGTQSIAIGTGRIDDWFADNADPTKIDLMRSGYDPVNRCAMWAFAENGQAANSAMLVYSLAEQKFSLVRLAMEDVGASGTLPASIETMPTPDSAGLSWDDPSYAGKRPIFAGINTAHTYGTFTGSNLAPAWATGDYQASPGKRVFVAGVRPIIDAVGAQVAVGEREQNTSDSVIWNAATAKGVDGVCPQRSDCRYPRFKMTAVAGEAWNRASAIEVDLEPAGMR